MLIYLQNMILKIRLSTLPTLPTIHCISVTEKLLHLDQNGVIWMVMLPDFLYSSNMEMNILIWLIFL